MKNIGYLNRRSFGVILCGLITWLSVMPAFAVDQPAPGKAKLKVETKTISKDSAAKLVASGEKITLGVYLVLDANWKTALESGKANRVEGQMSFGFFEDLNCTPGNFLQNPSDFIEICANPYIGNPNYLAPPRGTCCTDASSSSTRNWYCGVDWQNPGAKDGNNGAAIGWPDYAYGNLFQKQNQALLPQDDEDKNYYKYWEVNDGSYQFKLFEIQFILKNGSRNFPVAILDDGVQVQGALGATELNIMTGSDKYWPSGAPAAADWTGLKGSYFDFVNGGLFIENGPEVRELEPYFLS